MEKKKTFLNDTALKGEYMKLFEGGNTENTDTYNQIRQNYKIAKGRHIKIYYKTLEEWSILKDKALDKQIQANTAISLKSGLKSKVERLLQLQEQIESLNNEIKANVMIVSTFYDGEIITGARPMNSIEKSTINKTIKEIRAEISKIEGDYAPTKSAQTNINGEDVAIVAPTINVFSVTANLSNSELQVNV
jgi:hypothetical protein